MTETAAEHDVDIVVDHVLHDFVVPAPVLDVTGVGRGRRMGNPAGYRNSRCLALPTCGFQHRGKRSIGRRHIAGLVNRQKVVGARTYTEKSNRRLLPAGKSSRRRRRTGDNGVGHVNFDRRSLHLVNLQVFALIPPSRGLNCFVTTIGNQHDHILDTIGICIAGMKSENHRECDGDHRV